MSLARVRTARVVATEVPIMRGRFRSVSLKKCASADICAVISIDDLEGSETSSRS